MVAAMLAENAPINSATNVHSAVCAAVLRALACCSGVIIDGIAVAMGAGAAAGDGVASPVMADGAAATAGMPVDIIAIGPLATPSADAAADVRNAALTTVANAHTMKPCAVSRKYTSSS